MTVFSAALALVSLIVVRNVRADEPITRSDWPRFLNDDFSGAAKLTNAAPPSIAALDWNATPAADWSLDVGDGYGIGVVRAGAYFHFDAAGSSERLRKVDLATGGVLWSKDYPLDYRDMYGYETGPRCSPTLHESETGVQVFTFGVAGDLTAWDGEDGTRQWTVALNQTYQVVQNFFGVGSSPLVIRDPVMGDRVIVMVGGSPAEQQSVAPGQLSRVTPDGTLMVALDCATGQVLWSGGDDLASYSSPRRMRVNDGNGGDREIIVMFARDHLHVIDPRNGQSMGKVYHRADILESVNAMVPVVDGNRILVSDCYDLGTAVYDLSVTGDAADFVKVWKDPEGRRREQSLRSHMSTPILHEGFLYACSGRNAPDSDFRCLNFATGEVRWTGLPRRRSTATRVGDLLLVLKETGTLHMVRATPEKFDEIAVWELNEAATNRPALQYPCWSAPVVVGNQMLVRGDKTVISLPLPKVDR